MEWLKGKLTRNGRFRKRKNLVDQIFLIKNMVEECLDKGEKLYAAFIDLEKKCDKS